MISTQKIYPELTVPFPEWTPELDRWLHRQALDSGFDTVGIAPVAAPVSAADRLTSDRFSAWVEAGHAGEMDYLKRRNQEGVLLRSGVQAAIPWARSVIVCAFNYNAQAPLSIDPAPRDTGWIARYAWSGSNRATQSDQAADCAAGDELIPTDYHDQLLARLRHLETALQAREPCQTRCYVDTGPLIERAAAVTAGIGWIGKNTCVLNRQLGSWLLLGVIITSLPVASGLDIQPAADRCGSCTRCIDACPTDALIAPRQMDASRCISYLTIEKKGTIPEDLRPFMGRQVFGCDICQDVCPWNRRAPVSVNPDMQPRPELINPALEWLASMDAPTFKRYFRSSPLERIRRKRLLRNVAIAMGNSGLQKFVPILHAWTTQDKEEPGDPVLAESAQWALRQLRDKSNSVESPPPPLC